MKNLDQDLQEVYDQKMIREKIIIHVAGLKNRLQRQTKALALLEIEINKSETVIETLEQLAEQPLRKIFNKILGDKKQQVERERQNYLLYILRHQEEKKKIAANKYQLKVLEKKLQTLRNVDEAFEKLLKTKKQQLKHRNKDLAKKIIHFETNIRADQSMRKEIREAVDTGLIANKELEKLKKALLVMSPWRSQISPANASTLSYKQRSYINNLLAEIGKVNGTLDDFIQELSDVSTHYQLNYDQFVERISEFLEEFYDGLITDWVLHQEIKMTINLIDDTIAKVQRILILLEDDGKKSSEAERLDRISLQQLLLENKI